MLNVQYVECPLCVRVWTLFGNQPPHPSTFGKDVPKKTFFFWIPSLTEQRESGHCYCEGLIASYKLQRDSINQPQMNKRGNLKVYQAIKQARREFQFIKHLLPRVKNKNNL